MSHQQAPYSQLTPDLVLDAVESLDYLSDARIYPLNSYENRVYQIGIEEQEPLIAKFYRPQRWSDEQILEEHAFTMELESLEVPVVPPIEIKQSTLHTYHGFRFSLFKRRAGHAPELDNDDNLYTLGQHIGRIHALGASRPFTSRPNISIASFGEASREFLLSHDFIPTAYVDAYRAISEQLLEHVHRLFSSISYDAIRLHGDCHPGNILWRNDAPNFVDLDDARSGPAIQDLWMLLSGERERKLIQLSNIIEGYEEFFDFSHAQLTLIEPLRTLRLMHYAAWLARRWGDPAFPKHFPWFNTERYWAEHILELKEQFSALQEAPLSLQWM